MGRMTARININAAHLSKPADFYTCIHRNSQRRCQRYRGTASNPPRLRGWIADHHILQEMRSLAQSFFRREQAVFMFDGKHMVIAEHAKRGNELLPPLGSVPKSACAGDPAAVALVGVRLGVQYSGAWQVGCIELRILGMHVKDRIAQHADGRHRIDILPEHVAGIVVASNRRASNLTQPQHRFRAVDHKAGMHLDADLYAVPASALPMYY